VEVRISRRCGVAVKNIAAGKFAWKELGLALRICERFGQDPLQWLERLQAAPAWMSDVLGWYDSLRTTEERVHAKAEKKP
jgi:hypothetical protein